MQRWIPPLRAGRQPAGAALLRLLDDPRAPRMCLVRGPSGIGRTHLVAWLTTACSGPGTPDRQRPDAALSLAGMTTDGAVWSLARRLGVHARTAAELVDALKESGRSRLLFLRDLDRAERPSAVVEDLLRPLTGVPGLRLVAEGGEALDALGGGAAVLALDDPAWTDSTRFSAWYERRRGASPVDAPAVYPNPGLALLASRIPVGTAVDPAATDPAGEVRTAWWEAVPTGARPAIAALADAVQPLTRAEWSAVAGAEPVAAAAGLLPPDTPSGGTWWLPAGPLRDTVTAGAATPGPAELARALAATVPRRADRTPDPTRTDPARLGLVLRQAVRGGMADQVLDDPELLLHADPSAVTAVLAAHPDHPVAAAWRAAGPALIDEPGAAVRAAVLRARLPQHPGAQEPAPLPDGVGWRVDAHWSAATDPPALTAALGRGRYAGHVVLLTGDGTLVAVETDTGRRTPLSSVPPPSPVRSLRALPDGTITALGDDGRPHLLTGSTPPALPAATADGVRPTAFDLLPGETGGDALVVLGDGAGRVHRLPDTASVPLHTGPVTALAGLHLPDLGVPLLVSGGADGRVRVWKPGSDPMPEPLDERSGPVTGVAVHAGPYGLVVAAAWADGLVRVRRAEAGDSFTLRFGSPVRSLLIDPAGRVLLLLPEGLLSVTLDAPAPGTDGGSSADQEETAPAAPSLAATSLAAATPAQPPASAPSPAETALYALRGGFGGPDELLDALLDAELLVCPGAEPGMASVVPGDGGRDQVAACTSPAHLPAHWPAEPLRLSGRELALAHPDSNLHLNPDGGPSLVLPLRDLALAAARGDRSAGAPVPDHSPATTPATTPATLEGSP